MKNEVFVGMGLVFAAVGIMFGICFLMETGNLTRERIFEPRHEEVRRQTFEQSRAYREGVAQDLQSMQIEYLRAGPEQKEMITTIILHRTAGTDLEALPQDLQHFVRDLRTKRGL